MLFILVRASPSLSLLLHPPNLSPRLGISTPHVLAELLTVHWAGVGQKWVLGVTLQVPRGACGRAQRTSSEGGAPPEALTRLITLC